MFVYYLPAESEGKTPPQCLAQCRPAAGAKKAWGVWVSLGVWARWVSGSCLGGEWSPAQHRSTQGACAAEGRGTRGLEPAVSPPADWQSERQLLWTAHLFKKTWKPVRKISMLVKERKHCSSCRRPDLPSTKSTRAMAVGWSCELGPMVVTKATQPKIGTDAEEEKGWYWKTGVDSRFVWWTLCYQQLHCIYSTAWFTKSLWWMLDGISYNVVSKKL